MDHSGRIVTIFGGSGFVGTQLVQHLARRGYRIRVAVRRPDLAGHVRPLGAVGQVQPIQANIRNPESVMRAVAGAHVVINLVGVLYEKGRQRFRAVHTMGARNVAEAARAAGAERFIHMSALGADLNSPSASARSKAMGEDEVLKIFPDAVIMRPSIQFGPGDDFFNMFGEMARLSPVLPLISGNTRFQPVYVGDVAEAIALAAEGAVRGGRVYELGGSEILTFRQLLELVLVQTGRSNMLLPLPNWLARLMGTVSGILPHPPITVDQVVQLGIDNVVSEDAIKQKRTLAAFGISPTNLEAILPSYMWRFRRNGQFDRQTA
ncbi:MAG TPA: complex I NDUFA9 subunit family protein [Devosiaceae bacterium]